MLFKILHGDASRISTSITPYHEGYCYVTHDGYFYVDMNNERVKLNSKYADMLRYVKDGDIVELDPAVIAEQLANKVDKVSGKGLSTNDFTNDDKAKLDGIEDGANKTIVDSSLSSNSTNPVQNKVVNEKIEILQANIYNHSNSINNPHNTTAAQVGAAEEEHVHDAADITTGTLSIYRGGTGNGTGYIRAGQKSGTDIGYASTAEGVNNTASGDYSHAEGRNNTASGDASHAEGQGNTASNSYAHVEGYGVTATSPYSHAEGLNTTVSGNRGSHAEGDGTTASGQTSHAEGLNTVASGNYCHAEGTGTIAAGSSQHVQGTYNIETKSYKILHIVGNGSSDTDRSNAHTLDWDGNAWFAGNVYVGGTSQDDAAASKVVTEASISTHVSNAVANLENLAYINEEDTATSTNTINADTLGGYLPSMFAKQEAFDKVLDGIKPKAGFIYPLAGEVVPEGFLLCDGAAYSRTEYQELFAAIGTIYGAGDGSTTFNVPNLQTRVPVGAGDGYVLGSTGGEAEHTLTVDEMPSHKHTPSNTGYFYTTRGTGSSEIDGFTAGASFAQSGGNGGVSRTQGTSLAGGGQAHNNMQPYTVVNYIIATGKGSAVSVTDVVLGAQAIPLGVEYGGTGATSAVDARNNIGAAPAGYGLGDAAKFITDLNTATETGFYRWNATGVNAPFDVANGGGSMLVIKGNDNYIVQNAFDNTTYNIAAVRMMLSGTWGEWEWVNPPMVLGVEYRTTERWNGKPVYAKGITLGYIGGSTSVAHGASVDMPIHLDVYNNGCEILTTYSNLHVTADRTKIHLTAGNAFGNIQVYLKYTKL